MYACAVFRRNAAVTEKYWFWVGFVYWLFSHFTVCLWLKSAKFIFNWYSIFSLFAKKWSTRPYKTSHTPKCIHQVFCFLVFFLEYQKIISGIFYTRCNCMYLAAILTAAPSYHALQRHFRHFTTTNYWRLNNSNILQVRNKHFWCICIWRPKNWRPSTFVLIMSSNFHHCHIRTV